MLVIWLTFFFALSKKSTFKGIIIALICSNAQTNNDWRTEPEVSADSREILLLVLIAIGNIISESITSTWIKGKKHRDCFLTCQITPTERK